MTLRTQAAEAIIKTDVLGRMRTSAARRESLLDEFEKSGLSAKKFAGLSGLKYQTLAAWLQKRRRQKQAPARGADTVQWLETVVEQVRNPAVATASSVILRLPGGTPVERGDVKQMPMAAALVRALAQPC